MFTGRMGGNTGVIGRTASAHGAVAQHEGRAGNPQVRAVRSRHALLRLNPPRRPEKAPKATLWPRSSQFYAMGGDASFAHAAAQHVLRAGSGYHHGGPPRGSPGGPGPRMSLGGQPASDLIKAAFVGDTPLPLSGDTPKTGRSADKPNLAESV